MFQSSSKQFELGTDDMYTVIGSDRLTPNIRDNIHERWVIEPKVFTSKNVCFGDACSNLDFTRNMI
jgi:hypothetical protein